jgi:hypothetical protein
MLNDNVLILLTLLCFPAVVALLFYKVLSPRRLPPITTSSKNLNVFTFRCNKSFSIINNDTEIKIYIWGGSNFAGVIYEKLVEINTLESNDYEIYTFKK